MDASDRQFSDGVELAEPGSDRYRDGTSPRNTSGSQQPALVALPRTVKELAAAVKTASERGLVAVPQATGHGAGGDLGSDILLVDTSWLNSIEIDSQAQTAVVGAGAQWGAIDHAAAEFGLLGLAGSAPDVAVCGFTFGGGAGWLTRPYGLAAGALIAVDYVDGAGRVRRASDYAVDDDDREAMFAFRGGGGVGIAASLEFGLVPVNDMWAGYLLWPVEHLDAVVAAWGSALPAFGAALSTSIGVLVAPPGPQIPEELQTTQVVHLAVASSAGPEDAAPLLEALDSVARATVNTWGSANVDRLGGIHLDPPVPVPALGMARWLNDAAPRLALAILRTAIDSPIQMIEIRHVANDASVPVGALTRPAGDFMLHAVGDTSNPAALEAAFDQARAAADSADTGLSIGSWAEGRTAVPDALPADVRTRVKRIRNIVDPNGVIGPSRFLAAP